jgi:hypothetical protein
MTATIFSNIFIFYAGKGLGIFLSKYYILTKRCRKMPKNIIVKIVTINVVN